MDDEMDDEMDDTMDRPRYSNKILSEANGWLLPNASDVGEGGDINFNFSNSAMRKWCVWCHFCDLEQPSLPVLCTLEIPLSMLHD
jgi:hypothetical protein